MAVEIERKFLLKNADWRQHVLRSHEIRQAYLVDSISENSKASVRIRIEDQCANINIKSIHLGIRRDEYEYTIPLDDATALINTLCHHPVIEKQRHIVQVEGHLWEIDEFSGANQGLIVAEIELASIDEIFYVPHWLGEEVSDDSRYYNISLLTHPFSCWN